jgi:hypothetical protein
LQEKENADQDKRAPEKTDRYSGTVQVCGGVMRRFDAARMCRRRDGQTADRSDTWAENGD